MFSWTVIDIILVQCWRCHISLDWRSFIRTDQQPATNRQVINVKLFVMIKIKACATRFILWLNLKFYKLREKNCDQDRPTINNAYIMLLTNIATQLAARSGSKPRSNTVVYVWPWWPLHFINESNYQRDNRRLPSNG